MQSQNLQIPPAITAWVRTLRIDVPFQYLKHDFYSGFAVGVLLNKVYGEAYETRTLENNTSTKCARHNWARILQLRELNGGKFALDADKIEQIIAKNESAILDLLISIYEDVTGSTVPRIAYQVIPRGSQQLKSPPTTLKAVPRKMANAGSPERIALQAQERQYPPNVPMFARSCYDNSRALIDYLNAACKESVQYFDELHEFIEMLDPRADFCYPYAQLLLRLPKQYTFRVCTNFVKNFDVQFISSCISNDYTLFYDFAIILLQACVALNQVSSEARTFFDMATDILCKVIDEVKQQSRDSLYIIYQNIIMSRLIKEIPLINFSLPHFFKLCIACTSVFTQSVFNKILSASITNIKNTCPLYSENRLRFEVLLAFTMFAQQTQQYKDEIAVSCIKYMLHSILLPNQEKFLAIDLFVRCIHLKPRLFKDCEFAFLRLLGFLVNRSRKIENEDVLTAEIAPPKEEALIIICQDYEFEFWFSDITALNYEQVLFILLALRKLLDLPEIAPLAGNIKKIYVRFLEHLVTRRDALPPCFYYIGVVGLAALYASEIECLHKRMASLLQGKQAKPGPSEHDSPVESGALRQLEGSPVMLLASSVTSYLVHDVSALNALFSALDGAPREVDVVRDLAVSNCFSFDACQATDFLDDIRTQLGDFFFGKLAATLYYNTHAQDIAFFAFFLFIQRFETSVSGLHLLLCLLAMAPEIAYLAFEKLNDELCTAVLADDEDISACASDCLVSLMTKVDLLLNKEEICNSLHALVDFCFNYNGKDLVDTVSRKSVQAKCMHFLNQVGVVYSFAAVLLELVEKMDFDDFGNEQLAQFIADVRGEM